MWQALVFIEFNYINNNVCALYFHGSIILLQTIVNKVTFLHSIEL